MAKNLPPCDDSSMHHLERCALQLIVWREAIVQIQEKLDPVEYGYEKGQCGVSIMPQMMSQTPTLPELLKMSLRACAVRQIAHVVQNIQVQAMNSHLQLHVPVAV